MGGRTNQISRTPMIRAVKCMKSERTTPSCEFKFSFGSDEESLRHANALTGTTESCAPLSNPSGIGRLRPLSYYPVLELTLSPNPGSLILCVRFDLLM